MKPTLTLSTLSIPPHQRGMMMIEALMAILIFSLGILGMVGVNALAVASQSDAQYRTDANKFATQIINQIWVSVVRTTDAARATTAGASVSDSAMRAIAVASNMSAQASMMMCSRCRLGGTPSSKTIS